MLVSQEADFYFLGFGHGSLSFSFHVALDVDDEACGSMKMTLETNKKHPSTGFPATTCNIIYYIFDFEFSKISLQLNFFGHPGRNLSDNHKMTLQLAVQIDQRHLAPFYVGVAIAEAEERSFWWEMVSARIQ